MSRGPRLGETKELLGEIIETEGVIATNEERLVFCTDGVYELGTDQKKIGRKGFSDFLKGYMDQTSSAIVRDVENKLIAMNQGKSLDDDLTFVILEVERKPNVS